jgi:6,7-dimethyl-8-ribityllumazine synthase
MAKPANRSDLPPTPVDGRGRRIAICVARFNDLVTERLRTGARDALTAAGVAADAIVDLWVPGAFELPLAARWAAESGRFDAVVALGAVIRGGTDHYEHVCTQTSRGLVEVQLRTGVPIGFGLLTCADLDQALARAGGSDGNKGADAAQAALQMLAIRDALRG